MKNFTFCTRLHNQNKQCHSALSSFSSTWFPNQYYGQQRVEGEEGKGPTVHDLEPDVNQGYFCKRILLSKQRV